MLVFGVLIAIVGAILISVGQRMFWIRQIARWRGCVVEGTIVKWKAIRTPKGNAGETGVEMHQPTVEFYDLNGVQRNTLISHQYTASYREGHPVGSLLKVLIDPIHPDRVLDTTWTTAYILPGLLTMCGVLLVLLGLGVFFGT